MSEGANAATELRREHDTIEAMAGRVTALGPCPERAVLVREVARRFLTHVQAEERYLYAVVRRYVPQGETDAIRQARQGSAVRRIVATIQVTDENDATFDALAAQLVTDIERHIAQQDAILLPALIDACPPEEFQQLGRQLRGGLQGAGGAGVPGLLR